jgi:alkylation response protein AidB-like acyl-CoA dehydrogenase
MTMRLDDTPEEAAFRARVRAWLDAHACLREDGDDLAGFRALPDAEKLPLARAWQAAKAEAGYAALTLPMHLGGAGLSGVEQMIFRQEEARYRIPFGVYEIGMGMCIPTIAALGAPNQTQLYVPPAIRGETIWCQLFSEPEAGSDLAALKTRAVQDGDQWRVSGQKVWTTGAHFSDYGLLLARTDVSGAKHGGLTMFILDMRAEGVRVRPIRQMSGEADFNEVFLDNVRISDAARLGGVGEGWSVAMTTLMFERMNVGADIGLTNWSAVVRCARAHQSNAGLAQKLAQWYIEAQGVNLFAYRSLTALEAGRPPGPEQSIAKLVMARQAQDVADTILDLAGAEGAIAAGTDGWDAIVRAWYWGAAMRVAGGSDEVLRNVIAERVLGLPR